MILSAGRRHVEAPAATPWETETLKAERPDRTVEAGPGAVGFTRFETLNDSAA